MHGGFPSTHVQQTLTLSHSPYNSGLLDADEVSQPGVKQSCTPVLVLERAAEENWSVTRVGSVIARIPFDLCFW